MHNVWGTTLFIYIQSEAMNDNVACRLFGNGWHCSFSLSFSHTGAQTPAWRLTAKDYICVRVWFAAFVFVRRICSRRSFLSSSRLVFLIQTCLGKKYISICVHQSKSPHTVHVFLHNQAAEGFSEKWEHVLAKSTEKLRFCSLECTIIRACVNEKLNRTGSLGSTEWRGLHPQKRHSAWNKESYMDSESSYAAVDVDLHKSPSCSSRLQGCFYTRRSWDEDLQGIENTNWRTRSLFSSICSQMWNDIQIKARKLNSGKNCS